MSPDPAARHIAEFDEAVERTRGDASPEALLELARVAMAAVLERIDPCRSLLPPTADEIGAWIALKLASDRLQARAGLPAVEQYGSSRRRREGRQRPPQRDRG